MTSLNDEARKRVTEEFNDLFEKSAKLEALLENPQKILNLGISGLQYDLLFAQHRAMKTYLTILSIRIENWDK